MADEPHLPPEIAQAATLRRNEYGWSISSFPEAVAKAQSMGYACLGGRFQFWLDPGFGDYEIYWLDTESKERMLGESWEECARRSCSEVLEKFQQLVSTTDFRKIASDQQLQIDLSNRLVFVADFATEADLADLAKKISAL
jgi:hypothetical protein